MELICATRVGMNLAGAWPQAHLVEMFKLPNDPKFVEKLQDIVGLYFTPTGASWLNMVERFFSEITTKRIRRGSFLSVTALEGAIEEYLQHRNQNPKPFVWTATADDILLTAR